MIGYEADARSGYSDSGRFYATPTNNMERKCPQVGKHFIGDSNRFLEFEQMAGLGTTKLDSGSGHFLHGLLEQPAQTDTQSGNCRLSRIFDQILQKVLKNFKLRIFLNP